MSTVPCSELVKCVCMHVSLLAALPATSSDSSKSKESVTALVIHHHSVGAVGAALLRKRSRAAFFSNARDLHGTFNGEWD